MTFDETEMQDWLSVCKNAGLPLVIYGMGNGADKLLAVLQANGLNAADFMASDGFVRGQSFHGKRVKTYREIADVYPDFVILVAFGSRLPEVIAPLLEMARAHLLLVPDLPVAGETLFTPDFLRAHGDEFHEAMASLSDDLSRETFRSLVRAKITGRLDELLRCTQTADEIFSLFDGESVRVFADLGAYDGDTLRDAVARFPRLCRAVALEADARTFRKLSAYAEAAPIPVRAVYGAVSDRNGVVSLAGSANRNTSLFGASHEVRVAEVPTLTLDTLLSGERPDLIKADVEGAELSALRGGVDVLKACRPALKIAVYHRAEDLYAILLFLKSHLENYRYYVRRTRCIPAWEADLIALPGGIYE